MPQVLYPRHLVDHIITQNERSKVAERLKVGNGVDLNPAGCREVQLFDDVWVLVIISQLLNAAGHGVPKY